MSLNELTVRFDAERESSAHSHNIGVVISPVKAGFITFEDRLYNMGVMRIYPTFFKIIFAKHYDEIAMKFIQKHY